MLQHVKALQSFSALSQYLCSKCGSILKETSADIEISSLSEDCPNCGAYLQNTLQRRNKALTQLELLAPKMATAYDLMRFKIDIEKLSNFMPLSTTGALCISGSNANLLLTRLCVRSLLPAKYGGLGSPYAVIVDAGNRSDFYQTVNFIKQYGLHLRKTLDQIVVSRTFTIYQLKSILTRELPRVIQKYQPGVLIVPGLLDLFDDPNIKRKEARKVIERIMKRLSDISNKMLVIASLNDSVYADRVISSFEKRIAFKNVNHGRLNVDVYNQGRRARVTITERELKVVCRK